MKTMHAGPTPRGNARWGSGLLLAAVVAASGCAGLLPRSHEATQTPWRSYAEASAMYDAIVPGTTRLAELHMLGVDPARTANVGILGHADLLRRLLPAGALDPELIDPGLRRCLSADSPCFAYTVEQVSLDRQRQGSFWLDFFNFRREISISGWQFDTVVVMQGDTVVYKHWSGKPNVQQQQTERMPLGPLQGIGNSMIGR